MLEALIIISVLVELVTHKLSLKALMYNNSVGDIIFSKVYNT
jgi:hypothetical protein